MEIIQPVIQFLSQFIDIILHLDLHLAEWVNALGPGIYALLFLVVFCETGLVITPFLPGDSLLFAVGAIASLHSTPLELPQIAITLIVAAILGDAVNYAIGKRIGPKVFSSDESRWLNKKHLIKTKDFYEKHGGKTIILARFMPIVRTFAPFVAGIGVMAYSRFAMFNVIGAISWVLSFLIAGYYFGNIPTVKQNFHIVIFAIIIISFMPLVIEWMKSRKDHSPA